ncbi:MAG TPA: PKD domain-containing protein [Thermoplasmata archaeon]|nr:PKD domain-containing protein [Thermoplasmata archaeon]
MSGRSIAWIVVVAAFVAAPGFWVAASSASGPAMAPQHSPVAAHPGSHPTLTRSMGAARASPHPSVKCPNPPYPVYYPVGNGWPPVPNVNGQGNCPLLENDQVHASFFSNVPHSAQSFAIPIYLPGFGSTGQFCNYNDTYFGIVVGGNAKSLYNESYAEVNFVPTQPCPSPSATTESYTVGVMVWSFVNTSMTTTLCAGGGLSLSWNNAFWCVDNEIGSGSGKSLGTLAGNHWYNVSFFGNKGSSPTLNAYVNDTTNSANDLSFTFSSANTGSYTYYPFYDASCPDACDLNWSTAFGLGTGFDLTNSYNPSNVTSPSSYDEWNWLDAPPVQMRAPHSFANGGWGADYRYIAPESTSGVCTLFVCPDYTVYGGTGFYPYFTYNGSELNFGPAWPWTSQSMGGASGEYLSSYFAHDITPLWLDTVNNDSRGGYAASGHAVNVSARVQVLGEESAVDLNYALPGQGFVTLPMARISGNNSTGIYNATIPGTGGDGTIRYNVTAYDRAGASIGFPAYRNTYDQVVRGPLPHFNVTITTFPGRCGVVFFNGTQYRSPSTVSTYPGVVPIRAQPCWPYVFQNWSTRGKVSLASGAASTYITVQGDGSVGAYFAYVRPYDNITFRTYPSTCGSIKFNGNVYSTGSSPVSVLDGLNYSLSVAGGCAQMEFGGWGLVGSFTILGWNVVPHGNGTIIANFISASTGVNVRFLTGPPGCGGVIYNGSGYADRETLNFTPGSYAIGPDPCAHYGFLEWNTTGGVKTSGNTMTVTTTGTVREVNYHLTEVSLLTDPGWCGGLTWDGTAYTNGTTIVVANNSTHLVKGVACQNYYFFGWRVTGGVAVAGNVVTVNASGTLTAVMVPGSGSKFVAFITDPSTCGAVNFGGSVFVNANFTRVPPGSVVAIQPLPCPLYGFVEWITQGGVSIVGGNAYVNDSGSIEAVFRPLATVFLFTSPATCGGIALGGVLYHNNQSATVPEGAVVSLAAVPCAGEALSAWENSTGAILTATTAYFQTNSILTAVFAQVGYPVKFLLSPAACGEIRVGNRPVHNGSLLDLPLGSYPIQAVPCTGDHLTSWQVSGAVGVVANTTLNVTGPGNVTAMFQPVPPVVFLSVASSSLTNSPVELVATVQTLVPPYNYSYAWTFGDGSAPLTTPVNFTDHIYAHAGTYHVSVKVTDGLNRTANASQPISVVNPTTSGSLSFLNSGTYAVVGALVALAVALLAVGAYRRRHPPAEDIPPSTAMTPADAESELVPIADSETKP